MKTIFTIVKKELSRVFRDKRMIVMLLLPGILIFAVYSLLGTVIGNMNETDDTFTVYAVNLPEGLADVFAQTGFSFIDDTADPEEIKAKIKAGAADLYMVFPEDLPVAPMPNAPNIGIFYNSAESSSSAAYSLALTVLDAYESTLANVFNVNMGGENYDLADEKNLTGMIFSMIMPMLLTVFVFSSAMSYAPESIAGEKERGSIATLLVTPVKRSHLATGKIIALAAVSLIGGMSSFIGTVLSLPKLMGGNELGMGAGVYAFTDYLMLFFIVVASVLLTVAVIAVISAFSKSVKEAATYVSPLMILVMLLGFSGMFGDGAAGSPFLYLIPFYNTVQAIGGIFSFAASPLNVVVTVVSNIIYTVLLNLLLAKMFSSEKIMFDR